MCAAIKIPTLSLLLLFFLLIPNTPNIVFGTIVTSTGIKNIRVYLVIAVSAHVNIVYKWVAKVIKNVWAIDC